MHATRAHAPALTLVLCGALLALPGLATASAPTPHVSASSLLSREGMTPARPDKPRVEILGSGKVVVSWKAPKSRGGGPVTSYTVQLQEPLETFDGGGISSSMQGAITPERRKVFRGLEPGRYKVKVSAQNSAGGSRMSRVAVFVVS